MTVVPEIEMPGHAMAAIAAYPELGITGEPVEVAKTWGVFSDILNAEPSTSQFLQNVLTEVLAIFPGPLHPHRRRRGGQGEVESQRADPGAHQGAQAEGRARAAELVHPADGRFSRRASDGSSAGTRSSKAASPRMRSSCRGAAPKGGIAAARAGHDVVMAPTSHTYLDYYQSKDQGGEPLAIGGFVPLETVYAFEPIPAELEPQFAKHVLGAQGQLWTEYMPQPKQVEYMAFPRLSALAEVVWTPKERKDYADFLVRLAAPDASAGARRQSSSARSTYRQVESGFSRTIRARPPCPIFPSHVVTLIEAEETACTGGTRDLDRTNRQHHGSSVGCSPAERLRRRPADPNIPTRSISGVDRGTESADLGPRQRSARHQRQVHGARSLWRRLDS